MERVGISVYLNKNLVPFTGKIKQRYSDFLVREIDLNGKIQSLEHSQQKISDGREETDTLRLLVGEKTFSKIKEAEKEGKGSVSTEPIDSKEQRKKIHEAIRKAFKKLGSKTKEQNRIEISFSAKREKRELLSFVLYKENITTAEAVEKVSKATKIPSKRFSIAGTKDKKAVTVQKVTVKSSISTLQRCKLPGYIKISGIEQTKDSLRLGSLSGNHFDVFIREILDCKQPLLEKEGKIRSIERNIESVKEKGFINYFGPQRFGSYEQNRTHLIGLMILKGKWKEACKMILTSPKKTFIEVKIQKHLETHETDHQGAIKKLPWNVRLLYLHALQSYIWNKAVSRACSKGEYSPIALPGCSVALESCKKEIEDLGMSMEEFTKHCQQTSLHGSERTLIESVKNLEYSFVEYADETEFCLQKEMNSLMGFSEKKNEETNKSSSCQYLGLKISFSLSTSSYATVFLRELMGGSNEI